MPLRITKSIEPIEVKRITVCLYAVPGIGKTSTAFTADKTLLLDFDRGAYRSKNRGDVVQVEQWSDILDITQADLEPYNTIAIDTAGRALDVLTPKLIAEDPKMGRGGALTLPGFGRLKSEFIGWTRMLTSFGKDVILLSHSDESKHGDDLIERLDMQGASKNEIYKSADVMGRLYLKNGKRMLNFSPTDVAFGKNPASLPPLEVPDFAAEPNFFAGVISRVKAELNKLSEAQVTAAALQSEWATKFNAAATANDFTAMIPALKEVDASVRDNLKRMMVKIAKEKGFAIPKGGAKFEATEPPKAQSDGSQTSAQSSPSSTPSQGSPMSTAGTATQKKGK